MVQAAKPETAHYASMTDYSIYRGALMPQQMYISAELVPELKPRDGSRKCVTFPSFL